MDKQKDKDAEKAVEITFDTEDLNYEEVKQLAIQVKNEISDDSPYYPYKAKFELELDFFNKIYLYNTKLLSKVQEFNAEIVTTASKISSILKVVDDDSRKLARYKQDYDEVTRIIGSLNSTERDSRKQIVDLRHTVDELAGQVKRGEAFTSGSEESYVQIAHDIACLKAEIVSGKASIADLENKLEKQLETSDIYKRALSRLKGYIEDYSNQLNEKNTLLSEIIDEREKCKVDYTNIKQENEEMKIISKNNDNTIKSLKESIYKLKIKKADTAHRVIAEMTVSGKKKQHIMTSSRQLSELRNRNITSNIAISKVTESVRQIKNDVQKYKDEIKQIDLENVDLEKNLKDLVSTRKDITNEKVKYRDISKKSHKKLINIRQQSIMLSNAMIKTNIVTKQSREESSLLNKQLLNEEKKTSEVIADQKILDNEIYMMKYNAQKAKIEMRNIDLDTESKYDVLDEIKSKEHSVSDINEEYKEKYMNNMELLKKLKTKISSQEGINVSCKNERDVSKKRLQLALEEQKSLVKDHEKASEELFLLKLKLKEIDLKIVREHFTGQAFKRIVTEMKMKNDDLKKLVLDANSSISQQITQIQLLSHVLNDYSQDKNIQTKEYQAARIAANILRDQIYQRDKLAKKLREDILNQLNKLEKGKSLFKQKIHEIKYLEADCMNFKDRLQSLEKKKKYLKKVHLNYHNLYLDYNQELAKAASIVHELSIPRNVHRWSMYESVDRHYAKNLRYRIEVARQLGIAHQRLLILHEKRDRLKTELSDQKAKIHIDGKEKLENFPYTLEAYKDILVKQDQELLDMKQQIMSVRQQIIKLTKGNVSIKSKVSCSKHIFTEIKRHNISSKSALSRERNPVSIFLTEYEAGPVFVGGGFVVKTPTTSRRRDNADTMIVKNFSDLGTLIPQDIRRPKIMIKRPYTAIS